jgi:hypothetical protein
MKLLLLTLVGALYRPRSRGHRPAPRQTFLAIEPLEERFSPSITFVFDYSLDTGGFFASAQRRAVLQLAGQIVGSRLDDGLTALTPGGGNSWTASFPAPGSGDILTLSNLNVPANTLVVFAGGRDSGGTMLGEGSFGGWGATGSRDWLNLLGSRGQAGALASPPSDVGPWGGSVSFDATANWFFGGPSSAPPAGQYDFLSVAMHELGHVLGIGTAPAWRDRVSGGLFHGPASYNAYDQAGYPPVTTDGGHWAPGTTSDGQVATMTPSILPGQRKLFTRLDWAALQDIGWQVEDGTPVAPAPPAAGPFTAPASPAQAPGVFDPSTGQWYLRSSDTGGKADAGYFSYGAPGWVPLVGNWDGNGTATVGVYDPATATWYLRNENGGGAPDAGAFQFGAPGWVPVVGDWSGSGHTGIGVYDPHTGTWYLRNEASPGLADAGQFVYGAPGWVPVAGSWNGGGHAGVGVFDPSSNTWYLRNEDSPGAPDAGAFPYGAPGWIPVVGDWNGDGTATVGAYDPGSGTWYLRNSNSAGPPDVPAFTYGMPGWKPVVGNWLGGAYQGAADTAALVPDAPPPGALEGVPTYTLAAPGRAHLFSNGLAPDPNAAALGWSPEARSRPGGAAGAATDGLFMSA